MSCRRTEERRAFGARLCGAMWLELLGVTLLIGVGCRSRPSQDFFGVEGVVTVNGEPAGNASLAFHPLDRGASALCPVGRTDAHGRFRLTTHLPFDGAPVGDYAVTIVWLDEASLIDDCNCSDLLQHDRLKGFYADAEQTEFRVTVQRTGNLFRFDAWRARGEERIGD